MELNPISLKSPRRRRDRIVPVKQSVPRIISFFKKLRLISSTLLYITLVPALVILFIPIYLFRGIVSQLRKLLRPDLHKLVNTRSSVLCSEDIARDPKWNLVVWLTMDGILDMNRFRREFLKEYVFKRTPSGTLAYPEYQQHFATWLGFQFWRWEDNFDISDHIRPYDGQFSNYEYVDERILTQILKELTWKPWPQTKSPWEFMQISNYRPKTRPEGATNENVSILIFRIHHGFGDGYYILKLLMQDICGVSLERAAQPNFVRLNLAQKFIRWSIFWARAPYQFLEMMFKANDVNDWHVPMGQLVKPMNASLTDPIPLSLIKDIKNHFGVTFSAVLVAGLAGGIRNLMMERCVEVPKDMTTATAVPMPMHPPKLRNHFIFSFLGLPVGLASPTDRLKAAEKNLTKLKHSTSPILSFAKVPLCGGLFKCMMGPFNTNHLSTCLMSNFPGTPVIPNFKGVNVIDMMFTAGLGGGNTSIGFTMTSCVNHLRIMSQGDPSIFETDEDVAELNEKILEEFHILKGLTLA